MSGALGSSFSQSTTVIFVEALTRVLNDIVQRTDADRAQWAPRTAYRAQSNLLKSG
jgi:hypothetical protein